MTGNRDGSGGVGRGARRTLIEDLSPTSGWEIWKVRAGQGSPADSEDTWRWVWAGLCGSDWSVSPLPPNLSLPSSTRHVSWSLKQQNSPTKQGSPAGPIPALGVCSEAYPSGHSAQGLLLSPRAPPSTSTITGGTGGLGMSHQCAPPQVCMVTVYPQHKWVGWKPPHPKFLSRPSAWGHSHWLKMNRSMVSFCWLAVFRRSAVL